MNSDNFQLTDKLKGILDKVSPSPEVLATNVYNKIKELLPDLDDYSLLCFCIEYIGGIANVKANYLLKPAKSMYLLHYHAHYLRIYESWMNRLPQKQEPQNSISTETLEAASSVTKDQDIDSSTKLGLQIISDDTFIPKVEE